MADKNFNELPYVPLQDIRDDDEFVLWHKGDSTTRKVHLEDLGEVISNHIDFPPAPAVYDRPALQLWLNAPQLISGDKRWLFNSTNWTGQSSFVVIAQDSGQYFGDLLFPASLPNSANSLAFSEGLYSLRAQLTMLPDGTLREYELHLTVDGVSAIPAPPLFELLPTEQPKTVAVEYLFRVGSGSPGITEAYIRNASGTVMAFEDVNILVERVGD